MAGRKYARGAALKFSNCHHRKLAQYTITTHAVQRSIALMFNSTHTLLGLAVARTGPDRWAPHAAITAVIASNLPDIDILAELGNMPSYIEHHRGITHTFIGVPLLSLALAGTMFLFTRNFWRTFVLAFIVMATHPALDFANTYGLRPFLPFSGRWYYGDTLFIIDPVIDLILLSGILAGHYFQNTRRTVAWAALLAAGVYIGARVELHNHTKTQLDKFSEQVPGVEKTAVMPHMLDPLIWDGIVETDDDIRKVRIDAARGVDAELARMHKAGPSPIIDHAAKARSAAVLLGFARFPVTRLEKLNSGYRVFFLDFRFFNENTRTAFAAEVRLDQSLNVVNENLGFNMRIE